MVHERWRRWAGPWRRGGLTWSKLGRRVFGQIGEDQVFGVAAELAYYFLFSTFPLLLFLTALLGYVVQDIDLRSRLFAFLTEVVPSSAALELIRNTLEEVVAERGGGKISLGLAAALWAASSGMAALIRGLNAAFDVVEARPWWRQRVAALGFTLLFGLQLAVALTAIFYGEEIGQAIASKLDLGHYFPPLWTVTSGAAILILVVFTFDLLYNLAPFVKGYAWRWWTPGAVVGVWIWLAASLGFRLYLDHFDAYGRTYGSLGTVIILLLWFHLTGAALLVGAEVNSEIFKAENERGKG